VRVSKFEIIVGNFIYDIIYVTHAVLQYLAVVVIESSVSIRKEFTREQIDKYESNCRGKKESN